MIFGGEDHKTGQAENTNDCYARLEQAIEKLIPGIDVTHHWSGQVIETPDGLPYIGDTGPHQFAATGFSGNGMTFGTLSGMMATDRILGRKNPWRDLFDPGRKKIVGGAWDYIKENKDYPYYMLRDRFAGAEAKSLRAVKRGRGQDPRAQGRAGGCVTERRRFGDDGVGDLHAHGMPRGLERSGADLGLSVPRFALQPDGAVIGGPAETPLPKVEK